MESLTLSPIPETSVDRAALALLALAGEIRSGRLVVGAELPLARVEAVEAELLMGPAGTVALEDLREAGPLRTVALVAGAGELTLLVAMADLGD